MESMRPIKVIHLITHLDPGGAQMNTIYTVRNLDRKRFSASLWFGTDGVSEVMAEAGQNLVGKGDWGRMAELITQILEGRQSAELLGKRACEVAHQEEFDIDFMVHQQERLYFKLFEKNGPETRSSAVNFGLTN